MGKICIVGWPVVSECLEIPFRVRTVSQERKRFIKCKASSQTVVRGYTASFRKCESQWTVKRCFWCSFFLRRVFWAKMDPSIKTKSSKCVWKHSLRKPLIVFVLHVNRSRFLKPQCMSSLISNRRNRPLRSSKLHWNQWNVVQIPDPFSREHQQGPTNKWTD